VTRPAGAVEVFATGSEQAASDKRAKQPRLPDKTLLFLIGIQYT